MGFNSGFKGLRERAAMRVATNLSEETNASIFRREVKEIKARFITEGQQAGKHGLCNETDCIYPL